MPRSKYSIRFFLSFKCLPQDSLPLFKLTWNDSITEINQILEHDGSQNKYFFQSQRSQLTNQRYKFIKVVTWPYTLITSKQCNFFSAGVVYLSTHKNLSYFNFTLCGILLNQPVEFGASKTEENVKIFFKNERSGKKLLFELTRAHMNDQLEWKVIILFLGFYFTLFFCILGC